MEVINDSTLRNQTQAPSGWDWIILGKLGEFNKGNGIKKDESTSGIIPAIRYGEIYTKHHNIIRKFYSFISRDVAIGAKRLKKGDILFAGSGETKSEIGKSVAFTLDNEVYAGGDIVIFSPKNINSDLLGYLLNSPIVQKQKSSYGQGDAVVHISASNLGKINICIPQNIEEQTAIATALSEMDSLIINVEKLIEKKRMILSGLIKRLTNPNKTWKIFKVKDIGMVGRGRVISHREIDQSINKLYPVYSSQTSNMGIMGFIDSFDFDGDYITWTTDGVNAGTVFYREGKFNCTNVCGTIKLFDFDPYYISVLLGQVTDKYVSKNLANPKLMNDVMKNIQIQVPSLPLQKGYGKIIMGAERDIEAMSELHFKYLDIKQGMMQSLLTGKIRLI